MYPRAFDFLAPTSLEETLAILAERGDEVKVLAGGQSLLPMMKLRLAAPSTLLDINRLPDLDRIELADGHLRVGALVRHNDVVRSELVADASRLMASCAPWVADPLVRNRGTVCGSVAHADPEGDWASVMLALDAEVVAVSRDRGERIIPIRDFIVDMFTTALQPDELVVALRVPVDRRGGGSYQKLERKIGDYATVGVAANLELDDAGRIAKAGLALTSVYAHNLAVTEAEELLAGREPTPEAFAEAGVVAARTCDPASDIRGSAEYKRAVVEVFTRRAFAEALAAARAA